MRKLILVVAGILVIFNVCGQDLIVKCSGEIIKAKISEVVSADIKYKEFGKKDGPMLSIPKTEVFVLEYENGVRKVITPLEKAHTKDTSNTKITNSTIPLLLLNKGKVFINSGSSFDYATYVNKKNMGTVQNLIVNAGVGCFLADKFALLGSIAYESQQCAGSSSKSIDNQIVSGEVGIRVYPDNNFFLTLGFVGAASNDRSQMTYCAIGAGGSVPMNSYIAFETRVNFLMGASSNAPNQLNLGVGFSLFF